MFVYGDMLGCHVYIVTCGGVMSVYGDKLGCSN